jgi:molybdate transport system substrate-binding protein
MPLKRVLPALLCILLLSAACSSGNNTRSAATAVTTVPPATTVAARATPARPPVAAPTPAAGASVAARPASPTAAVAPVSGNLTVFAAASLTEVFNQEAAAFKQANPGIAIKFSYGASSTLRTQLAQGAPADVFASADQQNMDGARQDGSIDGPDQLFAKNKVVVITPKHSTKVQSLQDMAKPGVVFVLTDPSVPIGNYSRQILTRLSQDPTYGAEFSQKVLANLKSQETDVKAVVSKVQLGEADVGMCYSTDAATAAKDVNTIPIPDQFNLIATYPIAVVKQAQNKPAAQAFIAFVRSAAGQNILKHAGFITDSTTSAAEALVTASHGTRVALRQTGGYSPSFTLVGAVATPATYTLSDLQAWPAQTIDVHYLSGTSPTMKTYTGVRLYDLLMAAQPQVDSSRKNDLLRDSISPRPNRRPRAPQHPASTRATAH